jgi:hypothetical protein
MFSSICLCERNSNATLALQTVCPEREVATSAAREAAPHAVSADATQTAAVEYARMRTLLLRSKLLTASRSGVIPEHWPSPPSSTLRLMPRVTTSARRRLDGPWTDNRGTAPLTPIRFVSLLLCLAIGLVLALWLTGAI